MSDINHLRDQMDEITLKMIKLLKERAEIAREIGNVKKSIGKAITDESREENLRKKVITLCRNIGLNDALGTRFLNFLLNESIKIQSEDKQTHLSIFLKAKEMEKNGKKIIHMEVGEPDFFPPKIIKEALSEVYDKGFLKYGDSKGLPQFRTELARYITRKFGVDIDQENILVSPGARFSIYLAITTLLNSGDEMIVIEPAWPAYKDCALNSGIKIRTIETNLENRWEPNLEQISQAINSNTKMIVLNYPNNPTGKILPRKLLDEIVSLAMENDLYILSDEIYSEYSSEIWKSILTYKYHKSIITQSFSKSHAMTGFRIGYCITSKEIIAKMSKLSALCLTNVSEPVQYVALKALSEDISENPKIIRNRLQTLVSSVKDLNLDFVEPDGAMYIFARVKKEQFDSVEFANKMLEYGLAIAPGEGFGNYRSFIRISACQDVKTLIEGMNILKRVLEYGNG